MLILGLTLLILSIAVSTRRDKSILYSRSSIIILLICFFINIDIFSYYFQGRGLSLFNGFFHTSGIKQMFHMFAFIISVLILQLNSFFPRKVFTKDISSIYRIFTCRLNYDSNAIINKTSEQFRMMEYCLIILFVVTGGTLLISSSDLISIFLSIELQSYGLYILCSTYRNSEKATSAGLTYFLLGGLSSCFILLSTGLVYINSGNTSIDGIYIINEIYSVHNYLSNYTYEDWYKSYYIELSLAIISVGFLFKIAAAPFHFWSPDVYDAIPTIVTTFVAVFAKISILVLLLKIVTYTGGINIRSDVLQDNTGSNKSYWTYVLLVSSFFSLIIGSVLGLTQYRIKRLYAYSTISHIGFILLALSVNTLESVESFIFYLIQYSLSNLNAFIILIAMGFYLYLYVDKNEASNIYNKIDRDDDKKNSPVQLVEQIKGYFNINPMLTISLSLTIFSFIGIPPMMGFFAKQMVLSTSLNENYIFLTIIGILTSVISAYYYLTLVKQMFFSKTNYKLSGESLNLTMEGDVIKKKNEFILTNEFLSKQNITISSYLSITIAVLTLIMLLFVINPEQFIRLASILAFNFFIK